MAKENHLLSIYWPGCPRLLLALVILCVLRSTATAQNVTDSFTPFLNASDLGEIDSDGNGNLWIASSGAVRAPSSGLA